MSVAENSKVGRRPGNHEFPLNLGPVVDFWAAVDGLVVAGSCLRFVGIELWVDEKEIFFCINCEERDSMFPGPVLLITWFIAA